MAVKNYLDKDGLSHVASYVNGKLTVVSSMPTLPTDLRTVLYIGPTTDDYAQGGIYILDTITNEWILISTADVSLYETSWTGTRNEWIALSADEQAKYEIVNITDDFGPMGDHVISGYYYNGQFYEEDTHTTLITPEVGFIYIDLPYDELYLYDDTTSEYVLAGGGAADSIVYVDSLPSTDIENVVYGLKTSTDNDLVIADGFLDSNELFDRTDGTGSDYVYTAKTGIILQASADDTDYKYFKSLAFNGTDWILQYADATRSILATGDTFYFKQIGLQFYAGNEDAQVITPLANGGIADAIIYVNALPSSDIENVIYGLPTSTAYDFEISDGFLDSNELFVRTDGVGDDYIYTAASGIVLQASEDDTEYKEFTSLEFDGTDWILTFGDSTTAILAAGDTFYFKQLQTLFYAGNKTEQILTPLASGGSSGGATYFAGEGIEISNHIVSLKPATPSTLGGIKPDNTTVEVTAAGTLKGNYQSGYGIKVNLNEISAKTFVGTTAEWNALTPTQQASFDTVSITDDGSTINNTAGHTVADDTTAFPQRTNLKFDDAIVTDDSVNDATIISHTPYTAGDRIDITNHVVSCDETVKGTFVGTTAEWDALPAADKAKYDIVTLTDDVSNPTTVVDTVADGNMNAVTSNAVYNVLATLGITEVEYGKSTTGTSSSGTAISFSNLHSTAPEVILVTTIAASNTYRMAQILSYDANGFVCSTNNSGSLQSSDIFWIAIW